MNERIEFLAKLANVEWVDTKFCYVADGDELERFAELVRQDEREANAKLLEDMGEKQTNQSLLDPWDCAAAIRARGNHGR